ncbi:MAG: 1,4-alpha-glucan branching protein GlgB [Gammaproteobacteria bacterium]|nr:1,4-alpha-glucan branching protein GlgB [Gammaproteobacteria bacterium]
MKTLSPVQQHLLNQLVSGNCHDPAALLGPHVSGAGTTINVYLPGAQEARIVENGAKLERVDHTDLFTWHGPSPVAHYQIEYRDRHGQMHHRADPYSFPPQLSAFDLHLFAEGRQQQAYRMLGANPRTVDGIDGVLFATWAPNACRVSVVGPFNEWDGRQFPMFNRGGNGIWELFVPGLGDGTLYKFEIKNRDTGAVLLKSDPYARWCEFRPATASVVVDQPAYAWQDQAWLAQRDAHGWQSAPMSIYEAHLGSWRRGSHGEYLNYRDIAHQLVPYVKDLGFTHIELLPVSEHPFDGSWGYQCTGFYAPTSRFGTPDDFRYFVDYCHQHGLGVILDWVAGHFPRDDHGLAQFDGTALYEHADPRRGEHRDWGTLIFNYGRHEVRNFLISNAVYWLDEFHVDGLRVDAVASMLYLDYSRKEGEWLPNEHGGRENLEAIAFLQELNAITHREFPGTITIAEESTSWPQVTRPTSGGGLGFSMKWNMGWMHDSLHYMRMDPVYRHFHHRDLTFGMLYAWSENFVLPYSHDEVVHGKGSLLGKMPGDDWQRFANLRLLYTFMFAYPGKKLLFMGSEFAPWKEWSHDHGLEFSLLEYPPHAGISNTVRDLNSLYTAQPALYRNDFQSSGFHWLDCDDDAHSLLSFVRRAGEDAAVVVMNFTPVPRHGYRLGVPHGGDWREVFNSDSRFYGGSDLGNGSVLHAQAQPWMNQSHSLTLTLPPLAALILMPAK